MSRWQHAPLKEITTKIGSGATPTGGENSYKESGISLIRSQNVYDYTFNPEGLAFIDEAQAEKLANVEIQSGDLLLNITGHSVGRCCIVPDEYLPARVNQHVAIVRVHKNAHSRYLLYYLNNPKNKATLLSLVHGGTRNALTKGIIEDFEVVFPPLPTQQHIAEILGRLDDKIEVNRRINRTLEAMAQALFKHWFVDFGPFQDGEFVQSELGLIPRGWKVKPLSSLVQLLSGGTPSTKIEAYWGGAIDWVAAKDVSAAAPFIMSSERTITPLGVQNSSTKILAQFTTIITARGTVGECGLLSREMAMNQTNYGLRGVGCIGEFTTYLLVQYAVEKLKQFAYGTVFDTITSKTFDSIRIPSPPDEVWLLFENTIRPWFQKMLVNQKENNAMTVTRDYLLPKLLSGEVAV